MKLKCLSDLRWNSHCGHGRKIILNYRIDTILEFLYHIYQNAVEELLEKKLIIPILGVTPKRLRLTGFEIEINECSTKEYINMVLPGIKNYYK